MEWFVRAMQGAVVWVKVWMGVAIYRCLTMPIDSKKVRCGTVGYCRVWYAAVWSGEVRYDESRHGEARCGEVVLGGVWCAGVR